MRKLMAIALTPVRNRRGGAIALVLSTFACGTPSVTLTPAEPPTPGTRVGWQTEEVIARAGRVREDFYSGRYPPQVAIAVDGSGRGWAAWERHDPRSIESARLDGGWGPPFVLRDCTLEIEGLAGRDCANVAVALNEGGRVIAGWTEDHGDWVCMASERRDGVWTPAVRVQDEPSGSYATRGRGVGIAEGPVLSLDAAGHAWMFWWRAPRSGYPNIPPSTLRASYSPPDGGWSAERTLVADAPYRGNGPAVVPQAGGERLVTWGVRAGVQSALISPSRRWRWSEVSRTGLGTYGPAVALLPGDDALVSWATAAGPDFRSSDLSIARLGGDLRVEPAISVAESGREAPQVAVSSGGTVIVVWPTDGGIVARSTPRWGEPLTPARAIATNGPPRGIQLAADPSGAVVVVWIDGDLSAGSRIAAGRFRPDGGWSEIATVYKGIPLDRPTVPRLAVDNLGNAVVVFSASPPSTREVLIYSVRYVAQ